MRGRLGRPPEWDVPEVRHPAAWLYAPSRREPWRTTLSELRRPMTPEEFEEWQRLTCGRAVLIDPEGEA